jgi:hypothetical protein
MDNKDGRGGKPESVYVRFVVKKWHWDRRLSQYFYLTLSVSPPPILQAHPNLNTTLIRKATNAKPGNLKTKKCFFGHSIELLRNVLLSHCRRQTGK